MQGMYTERPRKKKSSSKKARRAAAAAEYYGRGYDDVDPYSTPAYGEYEDRRAAPYPPPADGFAYPPPHDGRRAWGPHDDPYGLQPPSYLEGAPRYYPEDGHPPPPRRAPRAHHRPAADGGHYYDEVRRDAAVPHSIFGDVPPEGSFEDHYYHKYGGRSRGHKHRAADEDDRPHPHHRAADHSPPPLGHAPAPAPAPTAAPIPQHNQPDPVVDQMRGELASLHQQMVEMEHMHNNSIVPLHAELNALRAQVDRAHVLLERAKAPEGEIPLHTFGTTASGARLQPSTIRRSRHQDHAPSEDGTAERVEANRLPWPGSNVTTVVAPENHHLPQHHPHPQHPQHHHPQHPQHGFPQRAGGPGFPDPHEHHQHHQQRFADPNIPPHLHPELGPVTVEERHYYVVPPEVHHHHHEPAPRPPLHDELPPVTVEERRYGPFPMGAPFTPERHAFVRSHEYDEPPLTWSGHKPLAVPHYSGPPVMPEPPELRVIELEPPAPLLASPTFIEPARYTSSRYVPAVVEEPVQYVVPAVPPPERVLEYHHEYHPQEVQVVEGTHYHQPAAVEAQTYYIDHETGERLTEAEYQVRRELRLSHQEVVIAQSPQEVVTSYVTSHSAAPPQPRNLGTQTFYRDPETGEEIAEAEFVMRYPSIFGQLHGQGESVHVETHEQVQAATTWVSHAEPASSSGLQNFYVDPETREEISEAEFARRYAGTYLGALVGHGESEVEYLQPTTTYVISQEVEAEAAEPPQPQRPPVPTPSTVSSYTQPEELFTSPARSLDRMPLFTRDESETPKPEARPAPKRVGAYDNVRSRVFEQPKRKPSPSRAKPAKPAPKRGRTPSTRKGDLETPQPNSTTPQPHPANFVMESEQF